MTKAPKKDPLQEWAKKLVFHADGRVTNPDGIDAPEFFEQLDEIREAGRRRPRGNPLADREPE